MIHIGSAKPYCLCQFACDSKSLRMYIFRKEILLQLSPFTSSKQNVILFQDHIFPQVLEVYLTKCTYSVLEYCYSLSKIILFWQRFKRTTFIKLTMENTKNVTDDFHYIYSNSLTNWTMLGIYVLGLISCMGLRWEATITFILRIIARLWVAKAGGSNKICNLG